MKEIQLTQGQIAIVDDDDYERLSKHKWYAIRSHNSYRAVRYIVYNEYSLMSREIMKLTTNDGQEVDHVNGDTLDNRRINLRVCSRSENARNLRSGRGTSKYKGVSWMDSRCKYRACITFNYKQYHIGVFGDEIEAAKAYDRKAKELFGEFAYLNFPEGQ